VFRCVINMSVDADGWLLVELSQYRCARPDYGTVRGGKDPRYVRLGIMLLYKVCFFLRCSL